MWTRNAIKAVGRNLRKNNEKASKPASVAVTMETDPPVRHVEGGTPRFHRRLHRSGAVGEASTEANSVQYNSAGEGCLTGKKYYHEDSEEQLSTDAERTASDFTGTYNSSTVASTVAAATALAAAAAASLRRYLKKEAASVFISDSSHSSRSYKGDQDKETTYRKNRPTLSIGENHSLKTYYTSSSELTPDSGYANHPILGDSASVSSDEELSDTSSADSKQLVISPYTLYADNVEGSRKSTTSTDSKPYTVNKYHRPVLQNSARRATDDSNSSSTITIPLWTIHSDDLTVQEPDIPSSQTHSTKNSKGLYTRGSKVTVIFRDPRTTASSISFSHEETCPSDTCTTSCASVLNHVLNRPLRGSSGPTFFRAVASAPSIMPQRDAFSSKNLRRSNGGRGRVACSSGRSKSTVMPLVRPTPEERELDAWRRSRAALLRSPPGGSATRPAASLHNPLQRRLPSCGKRRKSRVRRREASMHKRSSSGHSHQRRQRSGGPAGVGGTASARTHSSRRSTAPKLGGSPRRRRAHVRRSYVSRHHRSSRSRGAAARFSNASSESCLSESSNATSSPLSSPPPAPLHEHGRWTHCSQGPSFYRPQQGWVSATRSWKRRVSVPRSRSCGLWGGENVAGKGGGSGGGSGAGGGGGPGAEHRGGPSSSCAMSAPSSPTSLSAVEFSFHGGPRLGYSGFAGPPGSERATTLTRKSSFSNSSRKSDNDARSQSSDHQAPLLPAQDSKEEFVQKFAQPKHKPEKKKKRAPAVMDTAMLSPMADASDDEPPRGRMCPFKTSKEPKEPEVENLSEVKSAQDVESWLEKLCGNEAIAAAPRPACEQAMCVAYAQLLNSGGWTCGCGGAGPLGASRTTTGLQDSASGPAASVKMYPCESQSDISSSRPTSSSTERCPHPRRSASPPRSWSRPRFSRVPGISGAPDLRARVQRPRDRYSAHKIKNCMDALAKVLIQSESDDLEDPDLRSSEPNQTAVKGLEHAEALLCAPPDMQLLDCAVRDSIAAPNSTSAPASTDRTVPAEHGAFVVDSKSLLAISYSRVTLSDSTSKDNTSKDTKEKLSAMDQPRKLKPVICGPSDGSREKTNVEREMSAIACGNGDADRIHPSDTHLADSRDAWPAGDRCLRADGQDEESDSKRQLRRPPRDETTRARTKRHNPLGHNLCQGPNNANDIVLEKRKISAKMRKKFEQERRHQNTKYTITYGVPDLSHCRAKVDTGLRPLSEPPGKKGSAKMKSRVLPKGSASMGMTMGCGSSEQGRLKMKRRGLVDSVVADGRVGSRGPSNRNVGLDRHTKSAPPPHDSTLFPKRQLTQIPEAVDEDRLEGIDKSEPVQISTDCSVQLCTDSLEVPCYAESDAEGTSKSGPSPTSSMMVAGPESQTDIAGDDDDEALEQAASVEDATQDDVTQSASLPRSISIHIPLGIPNEDSDESIALEDALCELESPETGEIEAYQQRKRNFSSNICDATGDNYTSRTWFTDCIRETKQSLEEVEDSQRSLRQGHKKSVSDQPQNLNRSDSMSQSINTINVAYGRNSVVPKKLSKCQTIGEDETSSESENQNVHSSTSSDFGTSENLDDYLETDNSVTLVNTEIHAQINMSQKSKNISLEADSEYSQNDNEYSRGESLSDFSDCDDTTGTSSILTQPDHSTCSYLHHSESNENLFEEHSSSVLSQHERSTCSYLHQSESNENLFEEHSSSVLSQHERSTCSYLHQSESNENLFEDQYLEESDEEYSDDRQYSLTEELQNCGEIEVRDENACGDQHFHNENKLSVASRARCPSGNDLDNKSLRDELDELTQEKTDIITVRAKIRSSSRARKRKRHWIRTSIKDVYKDGIPHDRGAFGRNLYVVSRFRTRKGRTNIYSPTIFRKSAASSCTLKALDDVFCAQPSIRPKSEGSHSRRHFTSLAEKPSHTFPANTVSILKSTSASYLSTTDKNNTTAVTLHLIDDPIHINKTDKVSTVGVPKIKTSNFEGNNTVNSLRVKISDDLTITFNLEQKFGCAAPVESYANIESRIEMENGSERVPDGTVRLDMKTKQSANYHIESVDPPGMSYTAPPNVRDFRAGDDSNSVCSEDSNYSDTFAIEKAIHDVESKLLLLVRDRGLQTQSAPSGDRKEEEGYNGCESLSHTVITDHGEALIVRPLWESHLKAEAGGVDEKRWSGGRGDGRDEDGGGGCGCGSIRVGAMGVKVRRIGRRQRRRQIGARHYSSMVTLRSSGDKMRGVLGALAVATLVFTSFLASSATSFSGSLGPEMRLRGI